MLLTSVSPVYSVNPSVRHISDSLLCLLFDSRSGSVLSGVMGLISELKSQQNNLHLSFYSRLTYIERNEKSHTSFSLI